MPGKGPIGQLWILNNYSVITNQIISFFFFYSPNQIISMPSTSILFCLRMQCLSLCQSMTKHTWGLEDNTVTDKYVKRIELGTSRTLSENHTTRPNALLCNFCCLLIIRLLNWLEKFWMNYEVETSFLERFRICYSKLILRASKWNLDVR